MAFDPSLMDAAYAAVIGGMGWMFKRFVSNAHADREKRETMVDLKLATLENGQERMTRTLDRIEVTLVGVSGENGLNSQVKENKESIRELQRIVERRQPLREERGE